MWSSRHPRQKLWRWFWWWRPRRWGQEFRRVSKLSQRTRIERLRTQPVQGLTSDQQRQEQSAEWPPPPPQELHLGKHQQHQGVAVQVLPFRRRTETVQRVAGRNRHWTRADQRDQRCRHPRGVAQQTHRQEQVHQTVYQWQTSETAEGEEQWGRLEGKVVCSLECE